MNEQLKLLIDLQAIDTIIINSKTKINSIPQKITEFDAPLKAAQTSLDKLQQQFSATDKKKKDKDQEIDELKQKVSKLKTRSSEIKNNKEYQAHLKEIENAEKSLKTAEEAASAITGSLESISKDINVCKESVKTEEGKISSIKEELNKEAAEAEQELKVVIDKRRVLVKQIEKSTYDLYMGILKTKRGLAVVNTSNELCHGCNMHIPPQMFVEIKSNSEIIHCPQCRRILYFRDNSDNS
ncbi:MAG: C4-type zinc ribbon domain-containing protein [Nitrospiraceae bacterium]|nr:C4-type zinc ribbon domain-containing protein [Nitrospiraceae bacterium]